MCNPTLQMMPRSHKGHVHFNDYITEGIDVFILFEVLTMFQMHFVDKLDRIQLFMEISAFLGLNGRLEFRVQISVMIRRL